ncbi:4065_t:CDS:2 [Diversispora eburnea]|uniref:3-dehydrosphinganine reductase n=1 Tax=Diversispora eburnea TaxID=1213867 RepID=A0A9N9CA32_9GLOM|nr:4065_t:CDS:2 [Diversispora eburnea]
MILALFDGFPRYFFFTTANQDTPNCPGLGKEIGKILAAKGAHVTICARNKKDLDIALEEIKGAAQHRNDYSKLIFNAISADLTKNEESIRALDEASAKHNGVPDIIFCNAGFCLPKVFIEQPIEDFEYMMQINYFGALYTAHGKIIFVSSVAALVGFMGYSAYSPSKLALRSLTECLRNELILYDIGVHCFFPGTMDTDSVKEENKIKPQATKKIEGDDKVTPEHAAKSLYKGLCKGNVFITSDLLVSNYLDCIKTRKIN